MKTQGSAIRFIVEVAWQAHFVKNMFIRPEPGELNDFKPSFVILNASKATNPDWQKQGLNSENFIFFNLTERMAIIGGTWYGGEMKKGVFSLMNYYLPLKGNSLDALLCKCWKRTETLQYSSDFPVQERRPFQPIRTGRLSVMMNMAGTMKGSLILREAAMPNASRLSEKNEPDIYHAIRRDALLENLVILPDGTIDFNDQSKTENTRVSYPIYHINNIVKPVSKAGPAKKVIFLSADAFGVLPPVSRLTEDQTKYYFLSGYTAKIAGTERGIVEPAAPFFNMLRSNIPDA